MRTVLVLLLPLVVVGCTTQHHAAVQSPQPPVVAAVSPTKLAETRYEVQGYREGANPDLRHEPHAVYRRTRVPDNSNGNFETGPRNVFAPISASPLPANDELTAELATQKKITADMYALRESMVEAERRMQEQYGQLVRQSGEARKLREQLEAERNRTRVASTPASPSEPPAAMPEVKW